jgi:hypothetical protein
MYALACKTQIRQQQRSYVVPHGGGAGTSDGVASPPSALAPSRKQLPFPRAIIRPSNFTIMTIPLRLLRPATRIRWSPTTTRAWNRQCDTRIWNRRGVASVPAAQLRFGQPLHETHPHLLEAGEGATAHGIRRCMLTSFHSHTRHHSPRVPPTPRKPRQGASAELDSRPRCE